MEQLSLSDVEIVPITKSVYFKPIQMKYTLNDIKHTLFLMETPGGVTIVIFNISRNVLVLVKQFRPAVYYGTLDSAHKEGFVDVVKYPMQNGITLELCAGVVDKNIPLEEIAREEVLEECGYDVPVSNLLRIVTYPTGIYPVGDSQTLYYCEVTDNMKVVKAKESDVIEVVEMSISEVRTYLQQQDLLTPPLSLFGLYWFLYNKAAFYEQMKLCSKL